VAGLPSAPPGGIPPLQPVEAIAWHEARVPMSKAAFDALKASAKKRAFTVAGVAQADLIASVQQSILGALTEGTTLEEFKAAMGEKLEAEWQGTVKDPAARLETIFRTNVQSSYNAGRHAQATDPETLKVRPFWQFDAVTDGRTTPGCRAANGTVLPADDPWWSKNLPPRHFNCRATFHTLTRRQAERLGVAAAGPPVVADAGFGGPPTDAP
jgi:SPP1 gp7 family putative phage head morphogenesis protein